MQGRLTGRYSEQFKLKVVEEYMDGKKSYVMLAQEYNIGCSTTVKNWVMTKQNKSKRRSTAPEVNIATSTKGSNAELERLRRENKSLKLLVADYNLSQILEKYRQESVLELGGKQFAENLELLLKKKLS